MPIEGLQSVRRFVIDPLSATDGTKGLMIEFLLKDANGEPPSVRLAMTEVQAADLAGMLARALVAPRIPGTPEAKT